MGYKVYYKNTLHNRKGQSGMGTNGRFVHYDSKVYASKEAASQAMHKYKSQLLHSKYIGKEMKKYHPQFTIRSSGGTRTRRSQPTFGLFRL